MLKRVGACAAGLEELEVGWVRTLDLCTDLAQRLGLDERTRLQSALRAITPVWPACGG